MVIDKRDILATSVRNVEELKRRYELDKETKEMDLSDYLKNDVFPITVANGGTGGQAFTSGSYLIGNGAEAVQEKTPQQVADDVRAYVQPDLSGYSLKPTLLWSNASPTSEFAAQTVTLSQSIEDFTHYSIVYRTDGRTNRSLNIGLIPKAQTAHLQSIINYVSYRTCSISTNKATFTTATYQWALESSGSRGTNNFFCMPMYIYGWNL